MSVVRQHPVPMRFVGIRDTFAESGKPEELLQKYGLTAADIVREAIALHKS
jgi:transketolase